MPGSSGTATNAWEPRPSWPREGPPGASKCGPDGGAHKWPGIMLPTPQRGDCPPPSTCPSRSAQGQAGRTPGSASTPGTYGPNRHSRITPDHMPHPLRMWRSHAPSQQVATTGTTPIQTRMKIRGPAKCPPPWTPSHPSGQPHSHRSPRQPSPSPQTPNQLRPSDQHPPPPGPARRAANCRGRTAQCTPAARPRGTPRNLQQRGGQQTQRCCGDVYPPPGLPNTPPARASPPPSIIPRGCGLHANSTHEPTLLARADLRRRVPTPPPCRRGHRRVRGRQCHQRCL